MAITAETALEIFNNPKELRFRVYRMGGMWAFVIKRNVGNRSFGLVRAKPIFENDREAVQALDKMLEKICGEIASHPDAPAEAIFTETHRRGVIERLKKKGERFEKLHQA